MRGWFSSLVAALVCALPLRAYADEPIVRTGHALSLHVSGMESWMVTSRGDTSGLYSEHNGGNAVAAQLSYRSPRVIGAFADLGYYPIYRRGVVADLGDVGGVARSYSSMGSVSAVFGATADIHRFRLLAGLAWNDVSVAATTLSVTNHVDEWDLGYMLGVAFFPLRTGRFEVGVEGRALFITEAEITVLTLGATIGFDAVRF